MANVVIEPQPDGYPLIGRTGKDDMRSTREAGQITWLAGVQFAVVEVETYKLLLDAADQLARLQLQLNGLVDELDGAVAADTDAQRWLGYVRNRLKTIIDAERTKDP